MRRRGAVVLLGLAALAWHGRATGEESAMRIEVATEGGLAYLPGLAEPVTIDLDQLPAAEAERLRGLVTAARFAELPAQVGRPGGADRRSTTITVVEGPRRHRVTVIEPIEDPALRQLVRELETQARAARRRAAP